MPNIPTLMPVLGLLATAVAAFVIILKGLVIPVLLALLVYAWSCLLADRIVQAHKPSALSLGYYPKRWPAVISGTVVSVLVITAFVFLTYWTIHLASSNDLRIFLVRIEDSLEVLRQALPEAAAKVIPENWADLKAQLFNVVRSKAAVLGSVGGVVVHTIVQSLFAILVGALAAVSTWQPHRLRSDRLFIARLLVVLERVVIAQMRIALFNTTMTALYLFVLLPMFHGRILPFDIHTTSTYASVIAHAAAAGCTIAPADGFIAAIALQHHFSVATRDTRPFQAAGLDVINPWTTD